MFNNVLITFLYFIWNIWSWHLTQTCSVSAEVGKCWSLTDLDKHSSREKEMWWGCLCGTSAARYMKEYGATVEKTEGLREKLVSHWRCAQIPRALGHGVLLKTCDMPLIQLFEFCWSEDFENRQIFLVQTWISFKNMFSLISHSLRILLGKQVVHKIFDFYEKFSANIFNPPNII